MFRGYIVMTCCFFMTLSFGILYSYGVFFVPLQQQFGWGAVTDSTVPALALMTFSLGAIGGGMLTSRLGSRKVSLIGALLAGSGMILSGMINQFSQLLLLFGIAASLGASFVVIVATSLVVKWFIRNRGLAVGVMASGSGMGTLLVPPIAAYLIIHYGWRESYFILGSVFLALFLVAAYFMQTPEDRSMKPLGWIEMSQAQLQNRADFDIRRAISTRTFWLIYVMFFLGSVVATMFVVHAPNLVASSGMEGLLGAEAVGVFGAGSLISRIIVGRISDRIDRSRTVVVAYAAEFAGVAALPFVVKLPTVFLLSAFAIGFGYGGFLSDFISLTGDLFGSENISSIWGVTETAFGFGGLLGPIIAGAYFAGSHSYTGIFEFAAILAAVGLVISVLFSRHVRPAIIQRMV